MTTCAAIITLNTIFGTRLGFLGLFVWECAKSLDGRFALVVVVSLDMVPRIIKTILFYLYYKVVVPKRVHVPYLMHNRCDSFIEHPSIMSCRRELAAALRFDR